jgi:hypothetical protein
MEFMDMRGTKFFGHNSIGILLIIILFLSICAENGFGRTGEVEEIIVRFEVPKLVGTDIVAYFDGKDIYLPLIEILQQLDVNVKSEFDKGKFSGKFLTRNNDFEINIPDLKAECFGRKTKIDSTDFILKNNDCFLKIGLFQTIFELRINFNFSELKVYIPLNQDFPAYQKLKRKATHERLKDEKAALKDVQEIPYKRETLEGGVADWVLTINPFEKNGQYFGLGLGGMVLGGDLTVNGAINTIDGIDGDITRYRWHYYFRNNNLLTQAELGEISTGGSLSRNLDGVYLTNKPQIQREYFQTVDVSGYAGQGWEVEVYVNNRLVDFGYTDQNGDYNFLVDIHYGSSQIEIKMYGPNGEIKTKEEYIRTPFNLIPKYNLEYTLAAGTKEVRLEKKKYAQANGYFGVLENLTVGINSDIPFDSKDNEKPTFAGEITYQPFGSLLLAGSYAPQKAIEYNLNYSKPSLFNMTVGYTEYAQNEFWNRFNRLTNISFSLSSPVKIFNSYLGLRFRLSRDKYSTYDVTNMNYGFKIPIPYFHSTYLGNCKISNYYTRQDRTISSQLFISTSILDWFKPQFKIDYDHDFNRISKYGVYIHKRIFKKGQISLSFERNDVIGSNTVMLTFNIFNNFAYFTSRLYSTPEKTTFTQMQRGSIRLDQETGTVRFDRRNGQGLGTAVIWPFLDENYNGVLDDGEPLLKELRANIGGSRGTKYRSGELYYYDGLRPYDEYIVQVDQYSLDNPLLRSAHENFKVTVDPNTVTNVNVPIVTAGEISGTIRRFVKNDSVGIGGIKVKVENVSTGKETFITTFNDGEFFYLGLVPGMYKVMIDPKQLEKYEYQSSPADKTFQIQTTEGGDTVENLDFLLTPKQ